MSSERVFDPCAAAADDEVIVATYNVEALFDTTKDTGTLDHDYLPDGHYAWDEPKLAQKISNLARVVRGINAGKGPDLLALNEVENRGVVSRLRDEGLAGLGYTTLVHFETECVYGLDNAILSRFALVGEPQLHSVNLPVTDASRRARGLLEATFDVHGVALTVFVNHWPAGAGRTASQRTYIARQLRAQIERRLTENADAEVMVLGDFNATRDDDAFGPRGLRASADARAVVAGDPGATVYDTRPAEAGDEAASHFTRPYPYTGPDGEWKALDHIFVSRGLLDDHGLSWIPGSTQTYRPDFALADDGTPRTFFERGVAPRRQDLARTGFSDHLPVVTRLRRAGPRS